MIKGGYKLIDFKDTPFEVGGATMMIDGIYDSIEGSYRKPLLVTGLVMDGRECNDVYVTPQMEGSTFVFTVYGKICTITDTDAVMIAEA